MTAPAKSRRKPIRHGTTGGYRAHFRHGEPMCEPCRAADRTRKGYLGPQPVASCGTVGGYRRHLRHGEDACPPCLTANAAWGRIYKRRASDRAKAGAR
ncbi:hypothetical protein [Blastococcus sp. CT_GayMR16]|uniref:hypothetical protein n=1 Tax=Blastococcus sp. CT_GayMR16 TaxID=2559607 RepID=UPI001073753C|nr:hypothetical protein [Blastococcus sp. CT_GayMR16]TFV91381.1 hypothetical protein E4P38_01990 [Blastococcus sp. CT_GayMR16]